MNLISLERLNSMRFQHDPVPMAKMQRWCRNGELPARKIGGEWYVDLDKFDADKELPNQQLSGTVALVLDRMRANR